MPTSPIDIRVPRTTTRPQSQRQARCKRDHLLANWNRRSTWQRGCLACNNIRAGSEPWIYDLRYRLHTEGFTIIQWSRNRTVAERGYEHVEITHVFKDPDTWDVVRSGVEAQVAVEALARECVLEADTLQQRYRKGYGNAQRLLRAAAAHLLPDVA